MVSVIGIVNEVFGICVEGIKIEVGLQNAGTFLLALHFLWINWGDSASENFDCFVSNSVRYWRLS